MSDSRSTHSGVSMKRVLGSSETGQVRRLIDWPNDSRQLAPDEADIWLSRKIASHRSRNAPAHRRFAQVDGYRARFTAFVAVVETVFAEHPRPSGGRFDREVSVNSGEIGRGASGTVFEADSDSIGRQVAVKLLTGPSAASRTVPEGPDRRSASTPKHRDCL